MSDIHDRVLLILDDRERTSGAVCRIVGERHFGDIIVKRQTLTERFRASLPPWACDHWIHLRTPEDLVSLRSILEDRGEESSACIIAGRAGFMQPERLFQLVERLPYAEENFTDRLYRPLLVFLQNSRHLVDWWHDFLTSPVHVWERAWHGCQRVQSVQPLDLANLHELLSLTSGATVPRYFNEVEIDAYYYRKKSSDRRKMLAEYSFYQLVPEAMRPWLIEPFDYREDDDYASYKTLRYYLADAALQWVHGAFSEESFEAFVDRLMFFLAARPRKVCEKSESAAVARDLFVTKVEARTKQFLNQETGARLNALAAISHPELDLNRQVERYLNLYARWEKDLMTDYLVVGHGDPCFSNILYDQQHFLLKLIDPKGAVNEEQLWTHPLYDLCKISHSALGDYDFINNGLFQVNLDGNTNLALHLNHGNQPSLKNVFKHCVCKAGHQVRLMRLGEASLFLSMLPLHMDCPDKVIAFMLKAKHILDEAERGKER